MHGRKFIIKDIFILINFFCIVFLITVTDLKGKVGTKTGQEENKLMPYKVNTRGSSWQKTGSKRGSFPSHPLSLFFSQ